MEEEVFYSGYCRALDQSRMVCAVLQEGKLTEADCEYPLCPYATACPIAKQMESKT